MALCVLLNGWNYLSVPKGGVPAPSQLRSYCCYVQCEEEFLC